MMATIAADSDFGRFASRVKTLRDALGKTQQEFASMLGVSRSFLSSVENHDSKPSVDMMLGLLKLTTASKLVSVQDGITREEILSEHPIDRDWLLFGTGDMFGRGDTVAGRFRLRDDFSKYDFYAVRTAARALDLIEREAGVTLSMTRSRVLFCDLYEKYVGTLMDALTSRPGRPSRDEDARALAEQGVMATAKMLAEIIGEAGGADAPQGS